MYVSTYVRTYIHTCVHTHTHTHMNWKSAENWLTGQRSRSFDKAHSQWKVWHYCDRIHTVGGDTGDANDCVCTCTRYIRGSPSDAVEGTSLLEYLAVLAAKVTDVSGDSNASTFRVKQWNKMVSVLLFFPSIFFDVRKMRAKRNFAVFVPSPVYTHPLSDRLTTAVAPTPSPSHNHS
jgi:hypothetical protein